MSVSCVVLARLLVLLVSLVLWVLLVCLVSLVCLVCLLVLVARFVWDLLGPVVVQGRKSCAQHTRRPTLLVSHQFIHTQLLLVVITGLSEAHSPMLHCTRLSAHSRVSRAWLHHLLAAALDVLVHSIHVSQFGCNGDALQVMLEKATCAGARLAILGGVARPLGSSPASELRHVGDGVRDDPLRMGCDVYELDAQLDVGE